jgi:hypothetical protein
MGPFSVAPAVIDPVDIPRTPSIAPLISNDHGHRLRHALDYVVAGSVNGEAALSRLNSHLF